MVTQQLLDYIKHQLQQGISREVISGNLISQGWQQSDIDAAFSQTTDQNFSAPPTSNSTVGDTTQNGKAITGLILGIIGLIAWFIPIIGAPITIIGLILSIKGLKSVRRGVAIAGVVLSIIGLVLTIINASIGAYLGVTGQHPIVNNISNSEENQNSLTEITQTLQPTDTGEMSKTEFIHQSVEEAKAQLSLPYKVDQVTTMVDVTAEPDAIRYHYILSDIDTSQLTNELLRNGLGPNVCQDNAIRSLLSQDINIEYSYSVESSLQTYFVSFTETDCI